MLTKFLVAGIALIACHALPDHSHARCPANFVPPAAFARINVTSANDSGAGTLRAALTAAAPNTVIVIAPALCGQVLSVLSPLPPLSVGRVIIKGCVAGTELVVKRGTTLVSGPGLRINSSENAVCGLAMEGFAEAGMLVTHGDDNRLFGNVFTANGGPGVHLQGAGSTRRTHIADNFVGRAPLVSPTGTTARGNCIGKTSVRCAGILVERGAPNGAIDETSISGNEVIETGRRVTPMNGEPGIGIFGGMLHEVRANRIGFSARASTVLGSAGDGLVLELTQGVIVAHNHIGSNLGDGLHIIGGQRASVMDNAIGAGKKGSALGNMRAGVHVEGGVMHVIGNVGHGNDIAFNGGNGIHAATSGAEFIGPIVRANHVFRNAGSGLEVDEGVVATLVDGNDFERNGRYGVHLAMTSQGTQLEDNQLLDNACAVRLERGANGDLQAPVLGAMIEDPVTPANWLISGYAVGPLSPANATPTKRLGDGVIDLFWGDAPGRETQHHLATVPLAAGVALWQTSVAKALVPTSALIVATFTETATRATTALSERCDGLDQNCDGQADEAFDWDADGYSTCGAGAVGVPSGVDCDDSAANLNPRDGDGDGASMCSAVPDFYDNDAALLDDADCDGTPAIFDCCDGDARLNCEDRDGDGYVTCPAACGTRLNSLLGGNDPNDDVCPRRADACGHVDASACVRGRLVVPEAETCDGSDNDGDGKTDESFDSDGDGFTTCGLGKVDGTPGGVDCADDDPLVHPGAAERCDGVDDDCDGTSPTLESSDQDHDGLMAGCMSLAAAIDPDDTNPASIGAVLPVDDDHDGAQVDCDDHDPALNDVDYDGDGVTTCAGDCDDNDDQDLDCKHASLPREHVIAVDRTTGAFDPQWVFIHPGDTVTWRFQAPPDRGYAYDTILPVAWVGQVPELCGASQPVGTLGDDDFTGPMRELVPGTHVISSEDYGLVEEDVGAAGACCAPGTATASADGKQLCRSGELFETLDSTWADAHVSAISMRFLWNQLEPEPGVFDFTDLDRELDQAVAHGKSVSFGIAAGAHGTPDWIFSTGCVDANGAVVTDGNGVPRSGVERLSFQDGGDDLATDKCGTPMDLGSPLDPMYQCHFFGMQRAVADHIKTRATWYRAVSQVKITGANLFTEENRLPERCKCGCLCNTYVWATARHGAYTPEGLRRFYALAEELLHEAYPGKDVSYMLIQGGLPNIASATVFDSCCGGCSNDFAGPAPTCTLPTDIAADYCTAFAVTNAKGATPHEVTGVTQLRDIIHDGIYGFSDASGAYDNAYGAHFIVQHNGIAPIGTRSPNDYVLEWSDGDERDFKRDGARDGVVDSLGTQPSGFQTTNQHELATPAQLQGSLEDVWQESNGLFLEIYEARFWQAKRLGKELVDAAFGPTFADYDQRYLDRRRELDADFGWATESSPFRETYSFTMSAASVLGPVYYPYVHGSGCRTNALPNFGVIVVVPD